MTSVDATSAAGTPSALGGGQKATAPSNELGKNEFLRLLTAQLANQNPLEPMDNTQFIAQLAQFTSVEQLQGVNAGLDAVAAGQAAMLSGQSLDLIGKQVRFESSEIQWSEGSHPPVAFDLDKDATEVTVTLKNEAGKVVGTAQLSNLKDGLNEIERDDFESVDGGKLEGKLTVEIDAKDANGKSVTYTQYQVGRVKSVSFESGTPEVLIGDARIRPADILEVVE